MKDFIKSELENIEHVGEQVGEAFGQKPLSVHMPPEKRVEIHEKRLFRAGGAMGVMGGITSLLSLMAYTNLSGCGPETLEFNNQPGIRPDGTPSSFTVETVQHCNGKSLPERVVDAVPTGTGAVAGAVLTSLFAASAVSEGLKGWRAAKDVEKDKLKPPGPKI